VIGTNDIARVCPFIIYFYQIMLVKYLKLPGQVKEEDESMKVVASPCSKSLLPTPVLSSPVPKTNAKTVLRYIRQKYLNARRRKKELHLQRNVAVRSKKTEPEVCQGHQLHDCKCLIRPDK
jgi:hypothetical protein